MSGKEFADPFLNQLSKIKDLQETRHYLRGVVAGMLVQTILVFLGVYGFFPLEVIPTLLLVVLIAVTLFFVATHIAYSAAKQELEVMEKSQEADQ